MARNKLTKEEIKEDKFINFVLQCYTFLKDNVRTISIALAVVIVGVVTYIVYTHNQETKHAEAAASLTDAVEVYKEAESNFLDVSSPSETEEDTEDEASTEKATFQDAEEKFKLIFEKYQNTALAGKARYDYAKTLYYQAKYPEARAQFEQVIKTHKPENQIYALYAQKAVGNCYEQEGDYTNAISAYDARAFPSTPQLAPEIRQFVITNAKFNQALCHEKLNATEDAKASYKEIIDEFRRTLEIGIQQKSDELIKEAKEVLTVITEQVDTTKASQLESEELYFDAFVAYTDAIRTYKVKKDTGGGLLTDVRKRIRNFEDMAMTVIGEIKDARNHEKSGRQSSALSSYDQVVDFDKLGLSDDLYKRALLNYDRLTIAGSEMSNEE
jgi:tetratricopeptide (TPR) repeat protein